MANKRVDELDPAGTLTGTEMIYVAKDGGVGNLIDARTSPAGILTYVAANLATGNVVGPASSTDNALARFDLATGKLIQNSNAILDDSGNLSIVGNVSTPGLVLTNGGFTSTLSATLTANRTVQFPNGTGTVALVSLLQTFTNKTIDGSLNTLLNINATSIGTGTVDNTEFGYLDGVTSNIQTQLNSKFVLPALTSGSVVFSNGTTLAQDNANLFWDNVNKRQGFGTNTPAEQVHIVSNSSTQPTRLKIQNMLGSNTGDAELFLSTSGTLTNLTVGATLTADRTDAAGAGDTDLVFRNSAVTTLNENMRITAARNIGFLTAAPTHTLTQASIGTGYAHYNTADQTTNYERVLGYWNAGTYQYGVQYGGTGSSVRPIQFGVSGINGGAALNRYIQIANTATPLLFHSGTQNGGAGTSYQFGDASSGVSAASGLQNFIGLSGNVSQTGTAGYTGIFVNIVENTTGSGVKNLMDLQVGSASKFSVNNTGTITNAGTAQVANFGDNTGGANIWASFAPATTTSGRAAVGYSASIGDAVLAGGSGKGVTILVNATTGISAGTVAVAYDLTTGATKLGGSTGSTGQAYASNGSALPTWQSFQSPITLTTTGTSGAATFVTGTLNIPQYQAAGSYVTALSVASTNGFTGSSSGGTTPVLTIATSVTGLIKGNGTALSAAIAGTDYQAPITLTTTGSGSATFISNTLNIPPGATVTPYAETPTGLVNSSNTVYTIANTPANASNVIVVLDGLVHRNGVDYTISGTTITFVTAPATGSEIFVYYNTVAASSVGFPYVDVTATSITMTPNTIYYPNSASLCTLTLPSTFNQNDVFQIVGKGAGGWKIAQQAGQVVRLTSTSTTTGTGGSVSSGSRYDTMVLRVLTPNTELSATARNGSLVIV